jgi:ribosomal protein S18 acetylase RimI-like enzyme
LVVIGIRPDLQQKGLGTFLQQEFERKAIEMGAQQLQLSVRTDNLKAIKSYLRNGYEIEKEVAPSYVMIKKLN